MNIRQKLMFSFLGTSLLIGITSYISVMTNTKIKHDIMQVSKSSIHEVEGATEMTFALQAIETSAQELLTEKYRGVLEVKYAVSAEKEIKEAQEKIKQEIEGFEINLAISKRATETTIQISNDSKFEQSNEFEEETELVMLEKIRAEFSLYKKFLAQYIVNINTKPNEAEELLDETLEPHFREKLLPLIREYEEDAEAELEFEAREIEEAIARVNKLITTSAGFALLITIFSSFIISTYISKPIIKLKNATMKIREGKLNTRVNIKSNDELGILANAFNQMMDDLNTKTVSKSYVDNIISSMVDALIVLDSDQTITRVNQAALKVLGYQETELVGKPIGVILADKEYCKSLRINNLTKECFIGNIETTYLTKNGSKIPVSFSASVMRNDNGEIQGIVCMAQDITARKRTEENLQSSLSLLQATLESTADGILVVDNQGKIQRFNQKFVDMWGIPDFILVLQDDNKWLAFVLKQLIDSEVFLGKIRELYAEPDAQSYDLLEFKDGRIFERYSQPQQLAGQSIGRVWSFRDITKPKMAEKQLLHNALHDALTGLPNRVLFMDRLEYAIARAKLYKDYLFAVLFLDLDRFKVVNDSLGHTIGDQLLIAITHRLEKCLRPGDTFARLGGDEFTILLENIYAVEDATQVADRIQKELTLPFNLGGHEVFTAASIGIALSRPGYDQPEDILRDADTTMYRAKAGGRARSKIFDSTMHTQAMALLQLETDLKRSLQRQEFRLSYQPIVSLNSGNIKGFEALVRWHHPVHGIIPPAEFISLAEETGLIVPLGYWVLREACRQMKAWQMQFPEKTALTISVNISGKQFLQSDLVAQISQILNETGLEPRSLGLEITETVLMENTEAAAKMLLQLRDLGVRLYMDDFGTGYSSLSYLHRFPIDTLKIDRSFIKNVDVDTEKIEIICTVVALAWNLGMDVVAEGVETNKQMYQLRALKCEFGQGYFFSKPLDSKTAAALIAAEQQCMAV